jgi:uncharacterized surface protein with fasciclin (FAS1) repeats
MKKRFAVAGLVVASLTMAACGDDTEDGSPTETTAASGAEGGEVTTTAAETTDTAAVETTTADTATGGEEATGDIVAVATEAGSFTTLVAAVQAAGLVETLQGEGPFTVFAPTDDAFAALPEGVLEKLLLPENKEVLAQILTYHVVAGEVTSDMVTAGDVTTVEGSTIAVTTDGGVTLNGSAKVVTTDIMASNGVIHVIDAVILPPGVDPAAL